MVGVSLDDFDGAVRCHTVELTAADHADLPQDRVQWSIIRLHPQAEVRIETLRVVAQGLQEFRGPRRACDAPGRLPTGRNDDPPRGYAVVAVRPAPALPK